MKYSNLWKQCIGLLCIFIINGCSTFRFAPPPPTVYTQDTYTPIKYEADLRAYQAPNATLAERTKYRNKIVYSTASEIDKNYNKFKNSFFGERAATETSLDIVQIGLSSVGTLAGGETTKSILAAIATGLAGSRLSFNKNFFKEKTPDLLLSRMDALRAEQWSQIYLKLQDSDDTYSLYEAERDLIAYYETGSLQAAFQNILAESGAAQKKADKEIKDQIRYKYGEFMGPLAKASELKEIQELYREFLELRGPEQEKQAKRIIEEFKKLQPETPINPRFPNAPDLDGVKYLYGIAITENHPEVRKALTEAFKKAKSQQQKE